MPVGNRKANPFIIAAICLFCAAEGFIYVSAVILNAGTGALSPVILEYVSIILCFAFSLLFLKKKEGRLTAAALLFTAGADYFLVVRDEFYTAAVILFIIVQLIHMLNVHSADKGKRLMTALILRTAAAAAAETVSP